MNLNRHLFVFWRQATLIVNSESRLGHLPSRISDCFPCIYLHWPRCNFNNDLGHTFDKRVRICSFFPLYRDNVLLVYWGFLSFVMSLGREWLACSLFLIKYTRRMATTKAVHLFENVVGPKRAVGVALKRAVGALECYTNRDIHK